MTFIVYIPRQNSFSATNLYDTPLKRLVNFNVELKKSSARATWSDTLLLSMVVYMKERMVKKNRKRPCVTEIRDKLVSASKVKYVDGL